jgi:type IV secretory pathway TrbD component
LREDGVFKLIGLLCIIIGFVAAIIDEKILFGALTWFIAAIAFNTLGSVSVPFFNRRGVRR